MVLETVLLVHRSFYGSFFFFSFSLVSKPCLVSFFVLFCWFGLDRRGEVCRSSGLQAHV